MCSLRHINRRFFFYDKQQFFQSLNQQISYPTMQKTGIQQNFGGFFFNTIKEDLRK